ncbi:hypothetical protein CsSME_00051417 [Camellia sinensis var. sinensis]
MQKQQAMEDVKVTGDHDDNHQNSEPIRDTYKIAYLIHFVLGAGNLLPWNALITAVDYFGSLYPSRHVEKVFSVAYMSSSLLVLVLMMSWVCWSKKLSFRLRMNLGFSMFVLSIMVTPTLDWASYSSGSKGSSNGAYVVTVGSVVVCGLADGLIGGSLIGSAGRLPKEYTQAVFAGTASSGVLVSILRIITKASLPQTAQGLRKSAHLYFIVSTVILLGCIVCCNLLYKLPVMQQYYKLLRDDLPSSKPEFWEVARKIRWPSFGSLTATYVVRSIGKATWACIARLLFYPLFTVCLHGPNWLKTEVPMAFLTITLGLTNGYLTSVIMILTPKSVPASEAEVSAVVMAVFLGMGLVAGSVLGWFWII